MNLTTIPGQGFHQSVVPVDIQAKKAAELTPEQLELKAKRDRLEEAKQKNSGCAFDNDDREVWEM